MIHEAHNKQQQKPKSQTIFAIFCVLCRPLPMPKSDSGDARLTWSPPAVPFTAAVDCVDLYDPAAAAAFGDVPTG